MAKCKKRMRLIRRTVKRWNKVVVGWDVTPQEMEELWKQMVKAENSADSTSALPQVINVKHGVLLPEVDIKEKRLFVDYATFRDFDVRRDKEGYNKMNITLREYLKSQGYIVHDGELMITALYPLIEGSTISDPLSLKMSLEKPRARDPLNRKQMTL